MNWNLDDKRKYIRVLYFTFSRVFTWGYRDKERREYIRQKALENLKNDIKNFECKPWAFRIFMKSKRKRDIENISKLIVDAFSKQQIKKDRSRYPELGLYENDTIDYVKLIVAGGARDDKDLTSVEIFVALTK